MRIAAVEGKNKRESPIPPPPPATMLAMCSWREMRFLLLMIRAHDLANPRNIVAGGRGGRFSFIFSLLRPQGVNACAPKKLRSWVYAFPHTVNLSCRAAQDFREVFLCDGRLECDSRLFFPSTAFFSHKIWSFRCVRLGQAPAGYSSA